MKGILVPLSKRTEIHELHQNGTPLCDLTKKFGFHLATIYQILEEKKFKKKKCGCPQKLTSNQLLQLQTKFKQNPTVSEKHLRKPSRFPSANAPFAEN